MYPELSSELCKNFYSSPTELESERLEPKDLSVFFECNPVNFAAQARLETSSQIHSYLCF